MELDVLNEQVDVIMEEVSEIKKRHNDELKPYGDKIEALNELFLDGKLFDTNGTVVKKGMIIRDSKGYNYTVLRRYQQRLWRFLGNAQVEILKVGGKRSINISTSELKGYKVIPEKFFETEMEDINDQYEGDWK